MPRDTSETVTLDVHLRDGTVITTGVDADSFDQDSYDAFIEDVVGDSPRWVWIGSAYVFNRAIAAIAFADEAPYVGPELALPVAA